MIDNGNKQAPLSPMQKYKNNYNLKDNRLEGREARHGYMGTLDDTKAKIAVIWNTIDKVISSDSFTKSDIERLIPMVMRQQQTTLESRIRHTGKARLYPKVITNEQK